MTPRARLRTLYDVVGDRLPVDTWLAVQDRLAYQRDTVRERTNDERGEQDHEVRR